MKQSERELLAALSDANNFEDAFEADMADAPLVSPTSKGVGAELANLRGNPRFSAQFDISVDITYYDVTGAAVLTPAALLAAAPTLATQLAFPVFGNSDFSGGFKLWQERYPLSLWILSNANSGIVGINGATVPTGSIAVTSGDLLVTWLATVAANDYQATLRVRCRQVAYGTLLGSISSDRFVVNNIRYLIADATKVAQYDNQIGLLRQTLFGKVSNDFVSPASFKRPEQFQINVVDIPLRKGIDKETILASYVNYDAVALTWSIFVMRINKVEEKL